MPSTTWLSQSHWDALTLSSTTAPRGYPPPPSATPRDLAAPAAPSTPIRRPVGTAQSHERPSAVDARPSALDRRVDSRGDLPPPPLSRPLARSTRQPDCEDERRFRSPRSRPAPTHDASDPRARARPQREDDQPPRSATRNETAHAHAQRDAPSTRAVSPRRYEETRTCAFHSEREREAAAQTARTNLPGHRTGAPRAASTNHRGGPQEELPGEGSAGRTTEKERGGAGGETPVSTIYIYLPPPLSSPPAPRARPARPLSHDPRVPVERACRPLPSPAPPAHRARSPPADTIHPTHGPRVGVPSSVAPLRSRRSVDDSSPSGGLAPAPASHARPLALEAPSPELPPTSGALSPRSHARVVVRAHHEREAQAAEAAWRARLASYSTEPTAVVQVIPTRVYGAALLASTLSHDTRMPEERARVPPAVVLPSTRTYHAEEPSSRGSTPVPTSHASNTYAPGERVLRHPAPSPSSRGLAPAPVSHASDAHAPRERVARAFHGVVHPAAATQSGHPTTSKTPRRVGCRAARDLRVPGSLPSTPGVSAREASALVSTPRSSSDAHPSRVSRTSTHGEDRPARAMSPRSHAQALRAREERQRDAIIMLARVYLAAAATERRRALSRRKDICEERTRAGVWLHETPDHAISTPEPLCSVEDSRAVPSCDLNRSSGGQLTTRVRSARLTALDALASSGRAQRPPAHSPHLDVSYSPQPRSPASTPASRNSAPHLPSPMLREHWPTSACTGREFEATLRSTRTSMSNCPSKALPAASTISGRDGSRDRHSPPSPSVPGALDACPPSARLPSVSTDLLGSSPSQAKSLPADAEPSGPPPQRENLAQFWSSFLRKPQVSASV
ncbi:uncharacterized protein C8Q71DRAFT_857887 [Rhodofomes roseus]|uniref:Uncharacterized protein n=1 Tax=Rhodofomes roseus TaxID=34475 RepID=A0ABQ8KFW7_9APHY|nr:uncharacterized protein C8Q71DRAFT_857887 [Rhodofomes roseus]KAH9836667.1 hypothetical protein C8Q71DRAFT_857887 [Rhodofomes roseus]